MTKGDIKLLNDNSWTVECLSPIEIRHKDGSTATGQAVYMVVAWLYGQLQEQLEDEANWGKIEP